METREDTARFIEDTLMVHTCTRVKRGRHHLGWQDLRVLMDFIYEGKPKSVKEELTNDDEYKKSD